jgi:hypothetical protein
MQRTTQIVALKFYQGRRCLTPNVQQQPRTSLTEVVLGYLIEWVGNNHDKLL